MGQDRRGRARDEGGTDPSADRTDRKRSGTGTIAGRVETAATAEGRRGQEQVPCRSGIGNAQHAVHAEQAWLDMHGDSDFDDAALSDMVSNLLADTYETCFDTSRPQERPQRIAGGFDREGTAPFDVRVLRRIGNTVRARLQQIDERAVQLRADTERAMGDYLKHHPRRATPSWRAWRTIRISLTSSRTSTCSSPAPRPTRSMRTASKSCI